MGLVLVNGVCSGLFSIDDGIRRRLLIDRVCGRLLCNGNYLGKGAVWKAHFVVVAIDHGLVIIIHPNSRIRQCCWLVTHGNGRIRQCCLLVTQVMI